MNRLFIPLLLVSLFTHGALSAQDKSATKEKIQKEKTTTTTTTTTTKTTLTPKKPVAPVAKPAAVADSKKKIAEPAPKKATVAPAKKAVAAKPAPKKTVVTKTVVTKKTVVKKTKTDYRRVKPAPRVAPALQLPMQEMAGPAELRNFDIDMENSGPAIVEIKNGSVMVNGRNVAGVADTRANLRITINPKVEKEDNDDKAAAPKTAERESEHQCGGDNHCCHKVHMPSCETDRRHSVKYEYKTYRYKHPYYGRSW